MNGVQTNGDLDGVKLKQPQDKAMDTANTSAIMNGTHEEEAHEDVSRALQLLSTYGRKVSVHQCCVRCIYLFIALEHCDGPCRADASMLFAYAGATLFDKL